MSREHYYEAVVWTNDDGTIAGCGLNSEDSATWWDGTVYDQDAEAWTDENVTDGEEDAASARIARTMDLPQRIIDIYREWTGPNGYDINIMSDIAALLVEGGWVSEDDVIITGEDES